MYIFPSNDNKNAKIAALMDGGTSGADLAFYTRTQGDSTNTDGGEERVRITSSGNVIIGGTSPLTDAQLTLSANDAPALAFQRSGSGKFESAIGMTGNSSLRFYTGADSSTVSGLTERMQITSAGKVCINNDTALSDLHVCTAGSSEEDGTLRLGGTSAGLGFLLEYDQSSATLAKITCNPTYTNTSALLKICVDGDANADQLVLKGSGDIGINNATPASRLAIYDPDGHNITLSSHNWSGEARIGFTGGAKDSTGDAVSNQSTAGAIGVTASAPGGAATGHMSLYTNYGDSLQERLRLTAAGQAFFNSGKNTNFSAMAANHKGNFSSFESTTGVDSALASGVIHHAVVYRATTGRTDSLFSFKGSNNCGFFAEVTAYFSAATVGNYQGRQRMYFRASRNGGNNFQITQAHNYDKIGTNTTTFFNPLWGSSGSGGDQLLTVKVQTTAMTNYIGIMYVTRFICMDSINTFTTLL